MTVQNISNFVTTDCTLWTIIFIQCYFKILVKVHSELYSSPALGSLTFLCKCCRQPSPECCTFLDWNPVPIPFSLLSLFLYAVVILITFVLPRKVSLNSLGFVLCLSLEKGNWTNSLNREISLWGYGNAINWPGFSLSPLDNILSQKITIHNVGLSEDDTSVMFWNHHYWFLFWKINI